MRPYARAGRARSGPSHVRAGVDSQGRYIITGFAGSDAIAADNFINVSGSVWRIKVGLSYDF